MLLELLTVYDGSAVKQMEADLAGLQTKINGFQSSMAKTTAGIRTTSKNVALGEGAFTSSLARISQQVGGKDIAARLKEQFREAQALWDSAQLLGPRSTEGKKRAAEAQTLMKSITAELKTQGTITAQEEKHLNNLLQNQTKLNKLTSQEKDLRVQASDAVKEQTRVSGSLAQMKAITGTLGSRVGALAVGAVGGIAGAALAQPLWLAAEEGLKHVNDLILSLVDPTRAAKEQMIELGKAVSSVGGPESTNLEKATQLLKATGLGTWAGTLQGTGATAATIDQTTKAVDLYIQSITAARGGEDQMKTVTDRLVQALIAQDTAANNVAYTYRYNYLGYQERSIDLTHYQTIAETMLGAIQRNLNSNVLEAKDAANAAAQAATNKANADAVAAVAASKNAAEQYSLAWAYNQAMKAAQAQSDAAIAAASQPSKRTLSLQAKIAGAQGGGGGGGGQDNSKINEERALILLRMRLRLMGTAINIEKYEGKFRLEAINAKIAALQKEGDKQQRINDLIKLQYEQSLELERNQGETIKDFLTRRAQHNADLLKQQDDMERQSKIDKLNEQKDVLEDEIRLRELAEQAKARALAGGTSNYLKNLQKQLEASQKADQKAAEARRKAEAEKLKDLAEGYADARTMATDEATKTNLIWIRGMDTLQDVNKNSGFLAGLIRAKSSLEALVQGFGLPPWVAGPFLSNLNRMISAYQGQKAAIYDKVLRNGKFGGGVPMASGGVFTLTNANNFGNNIRTGEEGTEIGVVLSRQVTEQLRRTRPSTGPIGPFYVQGSDNRWSDEYRFKRLVKEAVTEAIR
jgi:hypothetical protein